MRCKSVSGEGAGLRVDCVKANDLEARRPQEVVDGDGVREGLVDTEHVAAGEDSVEGRPSHTNEVPEERITLWAEQRSR